MLDKQGFWHCKVHTYMRELPSLYLRAPLYPNTKEGTPGDLAARGSPGNQAARAARAGPAGLKSPSAPKSRSDRGDRVIFPDFE